VIYIFIDLENNTVELQEEIKRADPVSALFILHWNQAFCTFLAYIYLNLFSNGRVLEVLQKDLHAIQGILEMISEAELALGEFYRACALIAEDDGELWSVLEGEEKKHHAMVCRIVEMVTEKPDHFRLGRSFNEGALRAFVGWLREKTERMAVGETPAKDLLHIARDVEQSLIESRFCDAVQSDDVIFNELLNRIREETFFHRERISRRIKEKAYSAIILSR